MTKKIQKENKTRYIQEAIDKSKREASASEDSLLISKLIENWELYLCSTRMRSEEFERNNRMILLEHANKVLDESIDS